MSAQRPDTAGATNGRGEEPGSPESQLVAHLARERDERRERVLGQARAEAARLLAEARRKARRRVREAAAAERERAARERRAIQARMDSGLRQARHAATRTLLDLLWERLRLALTARWEDSHAREAWIEAALAHALERLPRGTWTLAYPQALAEDDGIVRAAIARTAGERDDLTVEPRPDEAIAIGVRIHCTNAVLDATDRGLLCKPAAVRARLLARLARREGLTAAGLGGGSGDDGDG